MIKEVIAIDLGASNIRVGIVDENLNIIKALRERTVKFDGDLLYEQIKRMIIEVTAGKKDLKYIGISACGICNNNLIEILPNLKISDFDLKSMIEKDFPCSEVSIANDANCSAYIEALKGNAMDDATSFYITISSGIGCGLIMNKKLIDLPFECGHNYIGYQNRFYEFEQLASGDGIVFLAKLNGLIVKDAVEFFSLVATNNPKAQLIYDSWVQIVAAFIANVQINFNPDSIILAGGVMKSKAIFENDLNAVANAFVAPYPVKKIKIKNALFDQDSGLMGATSLALALLQKEAE